MNKTKLGFKNLCLFVFILFMGIGIQILISCSSGGGGDTPHGGGSVSSGTDDPALYCVVDALSYCVTGLGGKQCRDDGYRGNSGYSDTKCPSGYDIITKVGSSSSFGGQGGISSSSGSSSIVNIISSSSSIGVSSSSSSSSSLDNEYAYCGYYGDTGLKCEYMNVYDCSGTTHGNDNSCGGCFSSSGISVNRSSSSLNITYGSLGTYKTVKIGTQTWMAQNLNYPASGSKCYDDQTSNCDTYGRLYDWATAMALPSSCNSSNCASQIKTKHKGICPDGWHIPSNEELGTLVKYVDPNWSSDYSNVAGTKLKAKTSWNDYNSICGPRSGNGTNDYGFSALPGGYGSSGGYFSTVGDSGLWWSASEYDSNSAYFRGMSYSSELAIRDTFNKPILFSVRCLQD